MTTDWYTSGFDPAVLPEGLRLAHDHWRDGRLPGRQAYNPLTLPEALIDRIGIFQTADVHGSGMGRFRLAGAEVVALHGAGLGTAPLRQLVAEAREELVEEVAELFADEDSRLPVFVQIANPPLAPDAVLSVLILPLARSPGEGRLMVLVYDIDRSTKA